jgi:hypothetical protein
VGRSERVAALLVAALEGIGMPEATDRIRIGRPVIGRYSPGSIWGSAPEAELLRIARELLF